MVRPEVKMTTEQKLVQVKLRMPEELKEWLELEAKANLSSTSSEIVRAVRERKDRCEKQLVL
jgi:predicted DNA-binding protein